MKRENKNRRTPSKQMEACSSVPTPKRKGLMSSHADDPGKRKWTDPILRLFILRGPVIDIVYVEDFNSFEEEARSSDSASIMCGTGASRSEASSMRQSPRTLTQPRKKFSACAWWWSKRVWLILSAYKTMHHLVQLLWVHYDTVDLLQFSLSRSSRPWALSGVYGQVSAHIQPN